MRKLIAHGLTSRRAWTHRATVLRALMLLICISALAVPSPSFAQRAFTSRYSGNANGDIYLIGNALMTCPSPPSTACTTARNGGNGDDNDFAMAYIDVDNDANTINSSSATLSMPAGSTVLFAGLYWAGKSTLSARSRVLFSAPGAFGYAPLSANQVDQIGDTYQGYANVTAQVKAAGNGSYTVANVQSTTGANDWAGWSLVVAFSNNTLPLRNMVMFDGFEQVDSSHPIDLTVSGFLTPLSGPVVTRLGTVAYDGDRGLVGDTFGINGTSIVDAANPVNNFFNSSISEFGANVSTRNPAYVNTLGLDIDRINVPTGVLANGATSATISFRAPTETVYPGVVTFTTDLYAPIIAPNLSKTVTDVNGGQLLAGDVLRYTISLSNTGQDSATNVILTDNIPAGTTYLPGSLKVASGANPGSKSDAAGDDQAEYIASGTPHIVARLGSGASASAGGILAYNAATSVTFDVTLGSAPAAGTQIANSATIAYNGQTQGSLFSATSAITTATVTAGPVIGASFSPASIDVNGITQLTIVLSNPSANPATLNAVTFSDAYPAGLVNSAAPAPSISCTAGATSGTLSGGIAGGNSIGMASGATIPPNGSCTVKVNVTAAAAGNYLNTTGAVASANGGNGNAASATLRVGWLALSKAFATSPVKAGQASVLTLTVSNLLALAASNVGFSDAYPSGLVNFSPPAASTTCAGGTVTATAGGAALVLSGASLAGNASCTVSVSVTGALAGLYANTSGGATSAQTAGAGLASNTATLTVLGPAKADMRFATTTISPNAVSLLSITVSNPNAGITLTEVAFTDNYPSNLVNASPSSATLNCSAGSSATLVGGANAGTTIGIAAGTLLAGGSCTVTAYVTSATAATYSNSSGTIASANAGSGSAAGAVLNVVALTPPTLSLAFLPTSIARGTSSVLTITLANSNASAITAATFTNLYPHNLVNAATPAATTTCAGATLTALAGDASVALSGATIPASTTLAGIVTNGTCTVSLSVTAAQAGSIFNTLPTGALSSTNAGTNTDAAGATLTVLGPPTIAKAFAAASVAVNTDVVLSITLANPGENALALSGVAFSDTYPAGLVNGSIPALTNTCGGTAAAIPGGNTLALSGAALAVGASCTVSVKVHSATAASYTNTTGAVSSANGGSGATASASLSAGRPAIAKTFVTSPIASGATSQLHITLSNPTASAMSGAVFSDTYPAGMSNAHTPAPTLTGSGCSGSISAPSDGASIALSGGVIPANGSCLISVTVSATHTVQNVIGVGALSVSGGGSNDLAAQATLVVNPPPQASMAFSPAVVLAGASATLSVSIFNANDTAMTGVGFTDSYPGGLLNAATPALSNTCGGSVTAVAGAASLALAGASVPANSSCSVTVSVVSASGAVYNNATGVVTSTSNGAGAPASAVLTVMAPPSVAISFSQAQVAVGSAATMSITLSNPNSMAISGAAFTDTYPAGLVNTASADAATSCSGAFVFTTGNSLALSGATIPAGGSCSVTVRVSSASAGSYVNSTGALSSDNAGNGSAASATLTVLANLTISVAFAPTAITSYGTAATLTFVVVNPNATSAVAAISFSDSLPANLLIAAAPALVGNCGGSVDAAAGGSAYALNGGALAAGASCTLKVNVTGLLAGVYSTSSSGVTSSAGGPGTASNSATLTVTAPDLRLALSHAGNFTVATQGVYVLSASNAGSAVSSGLITVVDTLPAGLAYVSASGTGWSCSAIGQSVTCTTSATIAAASTLVNGITLTVTVGSSAAPGITNVASISGGGEPASYTDNNSTVDPTVVSAVGKNSFAPDGMQTTAPGSTVFYLHQFNAGQAGMLAFGASSAPDPAIPGWNFVIYRDADCNGALSADEVSSPLGSAISVIAGTQVCIIVKEFAPASAPYNARDVITVSATLTPASGSASTQTRTDTTLIGSAGGAGLVLQKTVLNVTTSGTAGIANVARSGEALEYTITYSNKSSTALTTITIQDATPAYTHFMSAGCNLPLPMSISSCSASIQPLLNGSGLVEWRLGGTLSSAASGSVTFRVTVD